MMFTISKWLYCLELFICIQLLMVQSYDISKLNVGTVLFRRGDVQRNCWTRESILLLKIRCLMEESLPTKVINSSNGKYIDAFITYVQKSVCDIRSMSVGKTQQVMVFAFADAVGGYLRSKLLPITKNEYYDGNIQYEEIKRLYELYEDIKTLLKTPGIGWTNPIDVCSDPQKIRSLKAPATKGNKNDCKGFIIRPSKGTSSGMTIPIPYLDDDRNPHSVAMPIQPESLHSLYSPSSINILQNYYIKSVQCLMATSVCIRDVTKFNTKFAFWLEKSIIPHLHDEKWYPAFRGINRVMSTVKRVRCYNTNYSSKNKRAVVPYFMPERVFSSSTQSSEEYAQNNLTYFQNGTIYNLDLVKKDLQGGKQRNIRNGIYEIPDYMLSREKPVTMETYERLPIVYEYGGAPINLPYYSTPADVGYNKIRGFGGYKGFPQNEKFGEMPERIFSGEDRTVSEESLFGAGPWERIGDDTSVPDELKRNKWQEMRDQLPPRFPMTELEYEDLDDGIDEYGQINETTSPKSTEEDTGFAFSDLAIRASIFTFIAESSSLLLSSDLALLNFIVTVLFWVVICVMYITANDGYSKLLKRKKSEEGEVEDVEGNMNKTKKRTTKIIKLSGCPHRLRQTNCSEYEERKPAFTTCIRSYYAYVHHFLNKRLDDKNVPCKKQMYGNEELNRLPSARVVCVTRSSSEVPEYSIKIEEDTTPVQADSNSSRASTSQLSSQIGCSGSEHRKRKVEGTADDVIESSDSSDSSAKFGEQK